MRILRIQTATDVGRVRDENQDRVEALQLEDGILAVVCDGMGGERSGGEASRLAMDEAVSHFKGGYHPGMNGAEIKQLLCASVSAANSVVYTKSKLDYKNFGMGTTCVMVYVDDTMLHVANVGDSRAYLLQGVAPLEQLTVDHTVVQMLLSQGKITREEMKSHPQRNMLTRAIGVERTVRPDYFEQTHDPHFLVLLCSDGLSSYCTKDEITQALREQAFETVCGHLVDMANQKGGRDNITLAIISD